MHSGVWVHFVPLTQGLVSHAGSLDVAEQRCCCCQAQVQSTDAVSTRGAQGSVCGVLWWRCSWHTDYLTAGSLGLGLHEH